MGSELTDDQKQVFKDAAARRKANAIRLGRWCVMLDTNQIKSIDEFWNEYVKELGKQHAGDYLVVCMRKGFEALRDAVERRKPVPTKPRKTKEVKNGAQ